MSQHEILIRRWSSRTRLFLRLTSVIIAMAWIPAHASTFDKPLGERRVGAATSPRAVLLATRTPKGRPSFLTKAAALCALPPLQSGADLLLVSTYGGDSLSTVFVGGPDYVTSTIEVTIEPGDRPIYLVLSSFESVIWRLDGAINRVVQVVVGGSTVTSDGHIASGVVGINPKTVDILAEGCLHYPSNVREGDTEPLSKALNEATGRPPLAVARSYDAQKILLPSGTIVKATKVRPDETPVVPSGFNANIWRDALSYWPGGLETINPRSVVAIGLVGPYVVLPSTAGLAQLTGSGVLKWKSSDIIPFTITRSIPRLPPGMSGALSTLFLLAKGVPFPKGELGSSCITSEETGETTGESCEMIRRQNAAELGDPSYRYPPWPPRRVPATNLPARPSVARGLSPNTPTPWITNADYPPDLRAQAIRGIVAFRLLVSPTGKPSQCTVIASSGTPRLDDLTCRLMMQRASFRNAQDADGRPIAAEYRGRVAWAP